MKPLGHGFISCGGPWSDLGGIDSPAQSRLTRCISVEKYRGNEAVERRGKERKVLVVIAAQEDGERIGRIRLQRVTDASARSLSPAVEQAAQPGSIVKTDDWNGYNGLKRLGYVREIVPKDGSMGDNLLPLCNKQSGGLGEAMVGRNPSGSCEP